MSLFDNVKLFATLQLRAHSSGMSGTHNNDMEDAMRLLEEKETLVVAGGSNGDLADAVDQAEKACGKGKVKSVKVEWNEDGSKKSMSFTCKDGDSGKGGD